MAALRERNTPQSCRVWPALVCLAPPAKKRAKPEPTPRSRQADPVPASGPAPSPPRPRGRRSATTLTLPRPTWPRPRQRQPQRQPSQHAGRISAANGTADASYARADNADAGADPAGKRADASTVVEGATAAAGINQISAVHRLIAAATCFDLLPGYPTLMCLHVQPSPYYAVKVSGYYRKCFK
eukprot:6211054-Pleurochrysis_carterae.AAC.1